MSQKLQILEILSFQNKETIRKKIGGNFFCSDKPTSYFNFHIW